MKFGVLVGKCCDIWESTALAVDVRVAGKPELSNPMTTANCTGNEELDFRLIFGEDSQQQSLGPAGQCVPLAKWQSISHSTVLTVNLEDIML